MATDYELVTRSDRRIALVLHGPWRAEHARVMARHSLDTLVLNENFGWSEENLDFLADVPPLAALGVVSTSVRSLQGLAAQPHLRDLALKAYPARDAPFSALTELEVCSIQGRHKHIGELFELPNLRSLDMALPRPRPATTQAPPPGRAHDRLEPAPAIPQRT